MKAKRRWCRTVGVLSVAGLLSVGLAGPASRRDTDRLAAPSAAQPAPDGRFGVVDPAHATVTLAQAEAPTGQTARATQDQLCLDHPETCRLLDEALRTANAIPYAWVRAEAIAIVAGAQAEAGLVARARHTFADALGIANALPQNYRLDTLARVAVIYAEAGLLDEAQRTFAGALSTANAITDDTARFLALYPIAASQAEAGLWDDALVTASAIADDAYRSAPLGDVARAQARVGLLEVAVETAASIPGPVTRTEALADVARIQAEMGLLEEARTTLEAAQQAANDIASDERRSALFHIANVQAEAGLWDDALATAKRFDASYRSLPLSHVARAQAQAGRWDDAIATTNNIASHRLRSVAFADIAHAQAAAGLLDQARLTLREALNVATAVVNELARSDALVAVASAYAEAGQWHDALNVANTIAVDGFRSRALSAVALAQVESGQMDEARRTFAEAVDAAHAAAGAGQTGSDLPNWQAYPAVARAQAEAGFWEDALATANGITFSGARSEALSAIALAQAEAALAAMEPR